MRQHFNYAKIAPRVYEAMDALHQHLQVCGINAWNRLSISARTRPRRLPADGGRELKWQERHEPTISSTASADSSGQPGRSIPAPPAASSCAARSSPRPSDSSEASTP